MRAKLVIAALLLAIIPVIAADTPSADPARTPPAMAPRTPDSGAASLTNPPLPDITRKLILAPAPALRQSPLPFLKLSIPDPDDRANNPTLPVTPDIMPPIPTAPPAKPPV